MTTPTSRAFTDGDHMIAAQAQTKQHASMETKMNAAKSVLKHTGDDEFVNDDGLTHFIAIGRNGCWGKGKTDKLAIAQMNRRSGYREKNLDVYRVHKTTIVSEDGGFRQEIGHASPDHCLTQVVLNFTGRKELT